MIQLFTAPKNRESGSGPSFSLSLPECLALDLCFLSFFDFFDLDFDLDLFESLSSSLLEDSEDFLDLDFDLDLFSSRSSSLLKDSENEQ